MQKPHYKLFKKWFSDHKTTNDNHLLLDDLVKQWKDENLLKTLEEFENIDSVSAWQSIIHKPNNSFNKPTLKVISIRILMRYAAIFILPLATTIYLFNAFFNTQNIQIQDQTIALNINNQRSVLLGQNESTIYDKNNNAIAKANENTLTYLPQNFKNRLQTKPHTLTIPHGKTFQVTLSDGTTVYCDAGTTLTYPAQFETNSVREVQLKGQAFFDVAKSKNNPFVVITNDMYIEVLGTQFNINAYPETKVVKTVLIEGSIRAYTKNTENSVLLVPNQQVNIEPTSGKFKVTQVNAYEHSAWVTGKLVFNKVAFNDILKTLERKFAVQINNTNIDLGKQIFTAKFKNESIDQVLRAFKSEANFDYEVKHNTIIIK